MPKEQWFSNFASPAAGLKTWFMSFQIDLAYSALHTSPNKKINANHVDEHEKLKGGYLKLSRFF